MRVLLLFGFIFLLQLGCRKNSADSVNQSVSDPVTNAELDIKILAQNLFHPWEILWGPDNKIWMTERNGRISQVDPVSGQVTNLITINDVDDVGEGGLLGMALHPNFTATPQVFVVYNYRKSGDYTEKVVRYDFNGTTLINPVVILDDIDAGNIHNGSRLVFGPDQKLYISTGDAGNSSNAQNLSSVNGKILRINPDGTIPSDNPDPSSPVWSLGHRNAQGLVFANNKLYSSEHGPSTDDEINIIEKNRNYGWPQVTGPCNESDEQAFCTANNVFQPIYSWTPTIAPSGMDHYNSDLIPQWKNSLLVAVLKGSVLLQIQLNATGDKVERVNELLKNQYGRLRDVCVSPDGKVFISTDNGNDRIIVISKKN